MQLRNIFSEEREHIYNGGFRGSQVSVMSVNLLDAFRNLHVALNL